MNRRAGEEIFPIKTRSELEEWLLGRLGGATAASEIVDFNALRIPELDPAKVEKVLADNPVELRLGEEILEVGYADSTPTSRIDEELARRLQVERVVLPGGRTVRLLSSHFFADSVPELVEKLEKARIERAWDKKRDETQGEWLPIYSSEVVDLVARALSPVEIARTEKGELVEGFLSLKTESFYSNVPRFCLVLRRDLAEAKEETKNSIEKLVREDFKDLLEVPRETPWQKHSYFGYSFTLVGEALAKEIEKALDAALSQLPSEAYDFVTGEMKKKIETVLTALKEQYITLEDFISHKETEIDKLINAVSDASFAQSEISQIRGRVQRAQKFLGELDYRASRQEILAATQEAELLGFTARHRAESREQAGEDWRRVEGSLDDLARGRYDFRDSTPEEREQARNIQVRLREAFDNYQFDLVMEEVSQLETWMQTISAAAEERAAQRRKEYPDGIWNAASTGSSDPDELAQKGMELAQVASDFLGAELALYFLRSFHYGNLGKDRKRSEFFELAPEVEHTEVGEWLKYSIHRADDVDAIFSVAVLCLENQGIEPGRLTSQLAELMMEKQKSHLKLEKIQWEVESGEVALGTFTKSVYPKTGEEQWETEIRRDGETIKCVVDRFSKMEISSEKEYYFRFGKVLVDNPARRFKIMLVSPILEKDRDFDAEISALKAEADRGKDEKEEKQEKQNIESLASQLAAAWGAQMK